MSQRSLFDLSWKHKTPIPPPRSRITTLSEELRRLRRWICPSPSLSLRGRFGQVHKCVENSSGLTLAAKVIKARSLKEKVREPPHNQFWCYSESRPHDTYTGEGWLRVGDEGWGWGEGLYIQYIVHPSIVQGLLEQKQGGDTSHLGEKYLT